MSKANFHYEQRRLENDVIALEIFDPTIHTKHFIAVTKSHPELFTYTPCPPVSTEEDFNLNFYQKYIQASLDDCLWAIYDKPNPSTTPQDNNSTTNYAGIIALSNTNPTNAATEIGAIIFPAHQRTHISTHAIGLVLQWTLDAPSLGGLGLRRVAWQTHSENRASRRAALRMGFEFEGIARWQRVFPGGQVGLPVRALEVRNGTEGEVLGRHTAVYSIVWGEWEGKRERVVALMERKR